MSLMLVYLAKPLLVLTNNLKFLNLYTADIIWDLVPGQ